MVQSAIRYKNNEQCLQIIQQHFCRMSLYFGPNDNNDKYLPNDNVILIPKAIKLMQKYIHLATHHQKSLDIKYFTQRTVDTLYTLV